MSIGFGGFRGASVALLGMVLALTPLALPLLALTPTVAEAHGGVRVRPTVRPGHIAQQEAAAREGRTLQRGTLADACGPTGECKEEESTAEESAAEEAPAEEAAAEEAPAEEAPAEDAPAEEAPAEEAPAEESAEEEASEEPAEEEYSEESAEEESAEESSDE